MKGLLLKDWYMMKKYCRSYIVIALLFNAVSLAGQDNALFIFYPSVLCGMIPVNLLGYDERSRWLEYSSTMPYTKAQIVSAKYLIGLFSQVAVFTVTGIAHFIKMSLCNDLSINGFITTMLMTLIAALLMPSFSLPLIFKFGVEKGRIAYYVMIGSLCAVGALLYGLSDVDPGIGIKPNAIIIVSALVSVGIYILSWYLSIVFFKKREV